MNIKHLSGTGKSKTLKSRSEKPRAKPIKYTGMRHKGGSVSEYFRLKKQQEWLKAKKCQK